MIKRIGFLCVLPIFFTNCKSTNQETSLTNTKWIVETLYGKKVKLEEKNNEVFLTLDSLKKQVHGKVGCNRFFGNYLKNNQDLTFSQMGATKMACPDMNIEITFFKVLESTKTFFIKNDKLYLKDTGNIIAVFSANKKED